MRWKNLLITTLMSLTFIASLPNLFAQDGIIEFSYDFSNLSGLQLNNATASIHGGNPIFSNGSYVLRLTNGSRQAGSAFLSQPVLLRNPITLLPDESFRSFFQFRISDSQGISDSDGVGGDGFVFVIQSIRNNIVGSSGGYLGYSGINPSIGIEFDTYGNSWDGPLTYGSYYLNISRNGFLPYNTTMDILPDEELDLGNIRLIEMEMEYEEEEEPEDNKERSNIKIGCLVSMTLIVLIVLVYLFIISKNEKDLPEADWEGRRSGQEE